MMTKFMKKISKFDKWFEKNKGAYDYGQGKNSWNAACKSILNKIKSVKKNCDGFPQHEDLDYLEDFVKEIIEK